jgi:hypothetical protein
MKEPKVFFVDAPRQAGINQFIGRRPIPDFGNSDGDLQMLQWTAAGAIPRVTEGPSSPPKVPEPRRGKLGVSHRIGYRAVAQVGL